MLLFDILSVLAVCGNPAVGVALCQAGVVVVGAAVAHLAELYLRRVYVEKRCMTLLTSRYTSTY